MQIASICRRGVVPFLLALFIVSTVLPYLKNVKVSAQTNDQVTFLRTVQDSNVTVLDTGAYGVITFDTEGDQQMWVGANVGVGTDNPQARLDVSGSGGANQSIYSRATDGSINRIGLQNSNHYWTIDNYGTFFSPNGAFVISDQTAALNHLFINTTGDVGLDVIPTSTSAKLEVNGNLKATAVKSDAGAYILIDLNQSTCTGGACSGMHPINTWTDVAAQNYTWETAVNTDPTAYTHNGTGRITVTKAGTYQITLIMMAVPAADQGVLMYACPSINGAVNCYGNQMNTNGLFHKYYPGGWWGKAKHNFRANLAAGTTIGYAYNPIYTLSYWANNGYTAVEVTRIN